MATSIKNQLKIKSISAKNRNAKYKLTYRRISGTININGNLTYSSSTTTNLTYKGT